MASSVSITASVRKYTRNRPVNLRSPVGNDAVFCIDALKVQTIVSGIMAFKGQTALADGKGEARQSKRQPHAGVIQSRS